ncbi:hypothetical protein GCM10010446_65760 [Streptomyces enissocaesilis]|uniref:Uncharacterized protein n=1 Tax=Streptomyces enissocaesilis TaxID=332589 RepID=A0ABN3XQK3_9ACTN
MSGQQPYAVRLSPPAAKVLDALPEHVEQMAWDVLDAAAGHPWGFPQWDADDPEGEDVRIASVGHLLRQPRHEAPVRAGHRLARIDSSQCVRQRLVSGPALQLPDRRRGVHMLSSSTNDLGGNGALSLIL